MSKFSKRQETHYTGALKVAACGKREKFGQAAEYQARYFSKKASVCLKPWLQDFGNRENELSMRQIEKQIFG